MILPCFGIAAGMAKADDTDGMNAERRTWLRDVANENIEPNAWSNRVRQLAADLLDGAGGLRADPQGSAVVLGTDLVLRKRRPDAFVTVRASFGGTAKGPDDGPALFPQPRRG
ncbi:hypothetical protein A8V01_22210 [Novosphingobium guangzhouense]|uniref:Uncharacterized protein n=2 Tax=Novosphingobium guangzhouense TaxID=1850347 RepID=A0A2K2FY98_9SPHN|nr:hypothetical protein A8V01_22210 [Novosphingobium guangzhouense]